MKYSFIYKHLVHWTNFLPLSFVVFAITTAKTKIKNLYNYDVSIFTLKKKIKEYKTQNI